MARLGRDEIRVRFTGDPNRLIGQYDKGEAGPLMILIGGMHGNEPSGVRAARRVLNRLHELDVPFRGRVVAFRGNLEALRLKTRFVARDLNRMWIDDEIERLLRTDSACDNPEEREQRALLHAISAAVESGGHPVIFVDMHSASAPGPPFCLISDTLQNRELAQSFGIPVLLGLEESLDGTTLNYFGRLGYIAVGVEGGQHDAPETVDHLERILWVSLWRAGLLDEKYFPPNSRNGNITAPTSTPLPEFVEVYHRHGLKTGDQFRMMSGMQNFSPVHQGQILANDKHGPIRAQENGFVLLPLYQAMGDDGYFLGRPVRPFWLHLSELVRKFGLERVVAIMPGVNRHPVLQNTLRVDPRVARWYMVEVFHLLGYRKATREGGYRLFTRRPEGRSDGR